MCMHVWINCKKWNRIDNFCTVPFIKQKNWLKLIIFCYYDNCSYLYWGSGQLNFSHPKGNQNLRFGHQCQILVAPDDWTPVISNPAIGAYTCVLLYHVYVVIFVSGTCECCHVVIVKGCLKWEKKEMWNHSGCCLVCKWLQFFLSRGGAIG